MQKQLQDIATISSGQRSTKKVEHKTDGNVMMIQMKDLNLSNNTISSTPFLVYDYEISHKQLLKKGDILFMAKGNNNKAVMFDMDMPAVAVSLFFVIRLNKNAILPEYLVWFLNQKNTQTYLHSKKEGALVGNIKRIILDELLVNIPDFTTQKHIANIYKLSLREKSIAHKLIDEREKLISNTLINVL